MQVALPPRGAPCPPPLFPLPPPPTSCAPPPRSPAAPSPRLPPHPWHCSGRRHRRVHHPWVPPPPGAAERCSAYRSSAILSGRSSPRLLSGPEPSRQRRGHLYPPLFATPFLSTEALSVPVGFHPSSPPSGHPPLPPPAQPHGAALPTAGHGGALPGATAALSIGVNDHRDFTAPPRADWLRGVSPAALKGGSHPAALTRGPAAAGRHRTAVGLTMAAAPALTATVLSALLALEIGRAHV